MTSQLRVTAFFKPLNMNNAVDRAQYSFNRVRDDLNEAIRIAAAEEDGKVRKAALLARYNDRQAKRAFQV